MIKIIKADTSHIELIVPLLDQYRVFYQQDSDEDRVRKFLHERFSKNESVVFLALENSKPTGFTQLYTSFSSVALQRVFMLNDLFVSNSHRGKGIGEALLTKAKEHCKKMKYKGLALETALENPAQRLYEKLGWEKDSHCFHYFWTSK